MPRQAAPRGNPVPRRPQGARRRRLHSGLLAAAPTPEADSTNAPPLPHQPPKSHTVPPSPTKPKNAALCADPSATLREVNYVGAGPCEFLIGQDGPGSFLEVNTRL